MRAQGEMPINHFREVVLSHIAKRFREIVDDETIVVSEEIVPHLWDLPTWDVEVQTVDEGHVLTNNVRHGREEMAGLNHHIDRLVRVAEHCDAGITGHGLLSALEGAGLTERLHRGDHFLRHLLEVGDFVEPNDIPNLHHTLLPAGHVSE